VTVIPSAAPPRSRIAYYRATEEPTRNTETRAN
jgi:hypothetical protein